MLTKLFVLISVLLLGCSASYVQPTPQPVNPIKTEKQIISHIQDSTVIIMSRDEDDLETLAASCTGVWVDKEVFLTAKHCVDDMGQLVRYKTWSESSSSDRFNELYYSSNNGIVKAIDAENDLALVASVDEPPQHSFVSVSKTDASQGDKVHILGNGGRLVFSYMQGIVSTIRTMETPNEHTTRVIQISSPIWFGNSGCGAFNQRGELVGICSFLTRRAPSIGFFAYTEAVRNFVKEELR